MVTETQSFSFTTYNIKLYSFSIKKVTEKSAISFVVKTSALSWPFEFQTRL